ncbi:chitinase [Comamonas faecalis]|uniref:Chitinase n=1 Tax=Comamonas faecalis TaxID=1387849 RepID=A0ABP7QKI9_9BURK
MINRKFFFDHCRETLFTGRLRQAQVDGLDTLLDAWEQSWAMADDRWLAYALGTAFHETAFTMQPIRERGGRDYFFRMYDPQSPQPNRAAMARRMGAHPGDGVVFYGRGYVQLTWRTNYDRIGRLLGLDLTSSPAAADRAMQPQVAATILLKGMEQGLFTGKKLSDYFDGNKEDWKSARRIVNGLDCAEMIAVYARKFYACISYTVGP